MIGTKLLFEFIVALPRGRRVRDEVEEGVLNSVRMNPRISIRRLARAHHLSTYTISQILKQNKFHPYKPSLHQELLMPDRPRRLAYCKWLIERWTEDNAFVGKILFSHECIFHADGTTNHHTDHYWAVENPHLLQLANFQGRWSIKVWAGTLGDYTIGPALLEGNVTTASYTLFLRNILPVLLEDIPLAIQQTMWFQ